MDCLPSPDPHKRIWAQSFLIAVGHVLAVLDFSSAHSVHKASSWSKDFPVIIQFCGAGALSKCVLCKLRQSKETRSIKPLAICEVCHNSDLENLIGRAVVSVGDLRFYLGGSWSVNVNAVEFLSSSVRLNDCRNHRRLVCENGAENPEQSNESEQQRE